MRSSAAILALAILATTSCGQSEKGSATRSRDLGTGMNTVERKYDKPAREAWDAALASVKSYDMRIESDLHDELGGDIVARRADDHKVLVHVTSLDRNRSEVSVRVEPGNKDLAEMIHDRISQKLGVPAHAK